MEGELAGCGTEDGREAPGEDDESAVGSGRFGLRGFEPARLEAVEGVEGPESGERVGSWCSRRAASTAS